MEGLFDGEGLIGGSCSTCDRRHFPLGHWCPWCGNETTTEVRLSTEGTLWAWTSVVAPPPGYEGEVPYGFGVVELPTDGLRVISRLTESDPAALSFGQAMRFRAAAGWWEFEPV